MAKRKIISIDHPDLGLPEDRSLWQTEGLFSDHYLKARIQNNSWWPTDEQVQPILEFCKNLYEKRYVACAKNNEAFTRQELVDKILEKLGFAWTDNLSLPQTKQDLEPDYVLFSDAGAKERVIDKSSTERYQASAAILEAKKVNHPLSQISKHQGRYPHQQIRDYLNEAQTLNWGILTNGNEWRLYCRDTKPSQFFALNFQVAIKSLADFKYFLALFSPAAFVKDAQGKCRLDHIWESSLAVQSKLEADLRERIFTIVEILANGFSGYGENKITDDGLPRLYDNCLIFLYRLLFILYAEGRLLLPVEPRNRRYYKDFSLARLQNLLTNFSEFDSPSRTRLYEDMIELFHLINGTDEVKNKEYSVPRYNGGLFDPQNHPELERWRICDAVLADVLRSLIFNPPPSKTQPNLPIETVDYADLSVQQLGSIYEGLLEHHFVCEKSRLLLKTDKAERKATGTYYTPDYIVKYIVEHAVGPLLADIEESAPVKNAKAGKKQDNSYANAVLALNICDPAMGSGHFLVEATVYLADHIVYHPTTKFQVEFQRGESQEISEIAYWRRRVVEACVYGVDINPLAVELTKLSLWLTTISSDKPLNFLDHHLRCGNSLIGARLDQLSHLPSKSRMRTQNKSDVQQLEFTFGPNFRNDVSTAIREIAGIEAASSGNVAAIKDKEKRWREKILPALEPYKKVADLWTSSFFGNELDEEAYTAQAQTLILKSDARTESSQVLWQSKVSNLRFFHWELEFPDVFFSDNGSFKDNPGFDAVIGNPPYDVISEKEQLRNVEFEKTFYESIPCFETVVENKLNLYRLFVARALSILNNNGLHSFIVPMALLADSQSKALRRHILAKWQFTIIEAFPQKDDLRNRVFEEAKLPTCLYLIRKSIPSRFTVRVHAGKYISESSSIIEISPQDIYEFDPDNLSIPSHPGTTTESLQLALKLHKCKGESLYKYTSSLQGEVNLTTHKDFLSDDACGPIVLRGAHIGRYFLNDEPKQGEPKYLRIDKFLSSHGKNTKAHDYRFIRIGYQRGAAIDNWRRIIATIIPKDNFCSDTVNYIIKPKKINLYSILALINSSTWEWRFRLTSTNNHVNSYEIDSLPLPYFSFDTPSHVRKQLMDQVITTYTSSIDHNDNLHLMDFVDNQLSESHSDVVHDILAFLAERMTELNRQKYDAAKQFLTDLKDFHGIDVHNLKPKTKLNEFWKLEISDVFAHFQSNRKTLSTANVRLTEADEVKIRSRFQKSKDTIIPLESRIAFTDKLIDRIVYRLYGLTEEEVRMVEESVKKE